MKKNQTMNNSKPKRARKHPTVAECRRTESQKVHRKAIPRDLFVNNILPMLPQREYESAVMKAVKSKNAENLHFLLGYMSTKVPSFLKCNERYAKAAGFTIMLPKLHRLGFKLTKDIFELAVKKNDTRILEWLKKSDCPWDEYTFAAAAEHGSIDVLRWLLENGCPWNRYTFTKAAKAGNIDTLMWLAENKFTWNKQAFANAVSHGELKVLKWLKENGCPWDEYAFSNAVRSGNIEVLNWLKKNF